MEKEDIKFYEKLLKERDEIMPKRKALNSKYETVRTGLLELGEGRHELESKVVSIAEHSVDRYHSGVKAVKILQMDDFMDEEMAKAVMRKLHHVGVQRRISISDKEETVTKEA